MATNALTSFTAIADQNYGGMVSLSWVYPETLPAAWKLYIFKKQGEAVTDQQIANYFAGTFTGLSNLGIWVYNTLPAKTTFKTIYDLHVENKKTYYYRAVIRDTTLSQSSAIVSASAMPATNILINVIDAKDVVSRAIEKTLQSMKTTAGYHPEIEQDIKVFKAHGERKDEDNFFVVGRTTGQNISSTLSDIIAQIPNATIRGNIDYDIISVEWVCMGTGERRDKYTTIMRVSKQILRRWIMLLGEGSILHAEIIMLGDRDISYGPEGSNGAPALQGSMNIVVQTEQLVQIGNDDTAMLETVDTTFY